MEKLYSFKILSKVAGGRYIPTSSLVTTYNSKLKVLRATAIDDLNDSVQSKTHLAEMVKMSGSTNAKPQACMHNCRQGTLFRPFRSHQCNW